MEPVGFPEFRDFAGFAKLTNFTSLSQLAEKKLNSWKSLKLWKKRGFMEKSRFLPPRPTPTYKLSVTSMLWNIYVGQLGLAAWLCSLPAPAHLLIR